MSSGPRAHELRSAMGADPKLAHEVALTGSQSGNSRHWEDKPNAGYSGTPMWKIKAQLQEQQASAQTGPLKVPEGFKQVEKGSSMYYNDKRQVYWSGEDGKTYVYDAVMEKYSLLYDGKAFDMRIAVGSCFHEKARIEKGSRSSCEGSRCLGCEAFQARHVLVKDLAKAAQVSQAFMGIPHLAASTLTQEWHRRSSLYPAVDIQTTFGGRRSAEEQPSYLGESLPMAAGFWNGQADPSECGNSEHSASCHAKRFGRRGLAWAAVECQDIVQSRVDLATRELVFTVWSGATEQAEEERVEDGGP
eukprot:Skav236028  [mRNA]  locus=scaffold1509:29525:42821:+ [translate_table: standard]